MNLIDSIRARLRAVIGSAFARLVDPDHTEPIGQLDAWDAEAVDDVIDVAHIADLFATSEDRVRAAFVELVDAHAEMSTRQWIRWIGSPPPAEPSGCPMWLAARWRWREQLDAARTRQTAVIGSASSDGGAR